MHPLTGYAGQISLCHAKIEKISEKIFVMIDKDGGGQFLDFMGGHSCYEGGHRAHGGPPSLPPPGKTLLLVVIVYSKLVKYPQKV